MDSREYERRIEELEQKVRELTEAAKRSTLGTRANPIQLIYLLDPATGAVSKVTFDRDTAAVSAAEV